MKLRNIALLLGMTMMMPLSAQDYGYPKEKAFYKAHWNEIVKDLGEDALVENAQYILYDFDGDDEAELYLWLGNKNEYVYGKGMNKAVRVGQTNSDADDMYSLNSFIPYYMTPYQLLLDKQIPAFTAAEQHLYDRFDIPGIWFKLRPQIQGNFTLKKALETLYCFDCEQLDEILYMLIEQNASHQDAREFVMDAANGYAKVELNMSKTNMAEFCYWNLANGDKLFAMHYLFNGHDSDEAGPFEQTLFMKYDAKTKRMNPIAAPIVGFDFKMDVNFELPHKGKDIRLIGPVNTKLVWTGKGFTY